VPRSGSMVGSTRLRVALLRQGSNTSFRAGFCRGGCWVGRRHRGSLV